MVMVVSEPGRVLIKLLAESQTKLTATFVVATLEQTLAPTGKYLGPTGGLLLSNPITFHVSGVTVKLPAALTGETGDIYTKAMMAINSTLIRRIIILVLCCIDFNN